MIESYLRPTVQRVLVDPLVAGIVRYTPWTPLFITVMAGLIGILSAVLLVWGYPGLACFFIIMSGYLDAVDGSLARQRNASSSKGAVLDIVMDRLVEFSIMFGLFYLDPVTRGLPVIFMLGATLICVTSFLVVGVFSKNEGEKSFHYSVGLMERAEAFLFFIVMILKPEWFFRLAWAYTSLVFLTTVVRVFQFFKAEQW